MSKLKTPKFVDTIEDRAQKAFSKVKGDVVHIEQEQVLQNKHIEELYSLLKQLEQQHGTTLTNLQSLEAEYVEHLTLKHKNELTITQEELDKKCKEVEGLKAQVAENLANIEWLKDNLGNSNDEALILIAQLQDRLDAQKLDQAKEILHQFTKIREEFLNKEKLMYKELREELAQQIRKEFKEEIKQEVLDELNLNYVSHDEYALKVREILAKLKEAKAYVHEYTGSQVGIVQQQVDMLKELIENLDSNEAQERMIVILDSLTQKVEELDTKVEEVDVDVTDFVTRDNLGEEIEPLVQRANTQEEEISKLIEDVQLLAEKADKSDVEEVVSNVNALVDEVEEVRNLIPEVPEQQEVPEVDLSEIESTLKTLDSRVVEVENNTLENNEKIEILDNFLEQEVEDKLIIQVKELRDDVDSIVIPEVQEIDVSNFATKDEVAEVQEAVDSIEIPEIPEQVEIDTTQFAFKSDVDVIEGNLFNLTEEVKQLDEVKLESVEGLDDLQDRLDVVEEQIKAIDGIEEVDTQVFATKEDVAEVQEAIDTVSSRIDDEVTRIDDEKANKEDKADVEELDSIKDSVDELEKGINEIKEAVDSIVIPEAQEVPEVDLSSYAMREEVSVLADKIEEINSDLDSLDKDLTEMDGVKANSEQVDELVERLDEITKLREQLEELDEEVKAIVIPEIPEIPEKIDTTQFAFKSDVDVVEANLEDLSEKVVELDEQKAEKSEVEEIKELVDAHDNEIETLDKDLTEMDIKKANVEDIPEVQEIDVSNFATKDEVAEVQEAVDSIEIPEMPEEIDTTGFAQVEAVENLADKLSQLADELDLMNDSLDKLDKDLTMLDADKADRLDVDELKETVDAIEIPEVSEAVDTTQIEENIAKAQDEIVGIQEQLDEVKENIESKEDSQIVDEKIDEVKELIEKLSDEVEAIEIPEVPEEIDTDVFAQKEKLEEVIAEIEELQQKIVNVQEGVDQLDEVKVDKEEVMDLDTDEFAQQKTVDELVQKIEVLQGEVDAIEIPEVPEIPEFDTSELEENIASAHDSIHEVKELIESKEDSQIVDEKVQELKELVEKLDLDVDKLDKDLTDMDAQKANVEDIPEMPEEIDTSNFATKDEVADVQEAVDAIEIPEAIDTTQFVEKSEFSEEIETTVEQIVETTKEKVYHDLNSHQDKIDELYEKIQDVEDKKADKEELSVDSLYEDVDKLKETIESQQIQIDDLSKLEDLNEEIRHLEERVDRELDELKDRAKSENNVKVVEELEETTEELVQTIEIMKKELGSYVEFNEFEQKIKELDDKKLNASEFEEYVKFNIDAREVYEKAYIELLARFHEANHTSETKKDYQNEMNKAKKVILKFVNDESSRLKKSYDNELVDMYEKHLVKSVTRDCNYLRDSWKNLPISQGRDEANVRADEIKQTVREVKEKDTENFFTWFAFNKK